MHDELWGLLARSRYEDLLREAEAGRVAASLDRGQDLRLRQRLGRALIRLGSALAEPEAIQ